MKKTQKKIHTLRCENEYDEEFENLLEEDLLDIEDFLQSYVVEKADESSVDETIDVLRAYMPKEASENSINKISNIIKSRLELVRFNLSLVSKSYWIFSLLLILGGLAITIKSNENIYESILMVSPVPILLGLIELTKGKAENVWELELSYKYSLKELVLAKLVIIGVFSIAISILMSFVLVGNYCEINMMKMISIWLIPMFITASVSLFIVSMYRNVNSIGLCVGIWLIQANSISSKDIENLIATKEAVFLFVLCILIVVMTMCLKLFYKRTINYIDYKNCDF